jgi:hypothetical protein
MFVTLKGIFMWVEDADFSEIPGNSPGKFLICPGKA